MQRRTFLLSSSAVAAAAGLAQWAPTRALAAPGDAATDPTVANRTDLVTIATTVDGITLDGTLSDERWGDPHWQSFTTIAALDEVPDTALHAVHDDSTLYVGVRVSGAAAATITHVSCLIGVDHGSRYFSTTVQLRKPSPATSFSWGGTTTALEDHESAFDAGEETTTCEVAIPLAELGIDDPLTSAVSLNVVVDHQDMTRAASTSAPTRRGDNTYSGGTAALATAIAGQDRAAGLVLGGLAPLASGRTAPTLGRPEVRLDYVDFTHKRLTVALDESTVADQIGVDWRAPGQDWAEVSTAMKTARQGSVTSFEHEGPTAEGQYQVRIRIRARSGDDQVVIATFDREDLIAAGDRLEQNQPHPPTGGTTVEPVEPSDEVAALIALVPDRTGFTFCGVPDNPGLHPNNTFDWSADDPDVLVAKSTGTRYPHPDFPEDKELVVTNRLGDEVSYPYHEDADGKRYFLSAHLWFRQRSHVYGKLVGLAQTDPLGAARVLHRFAQVYPGWVPTNEYPWLNRPVAPAATPRNHWWGGTWSRWSTSELSAMSDLGGALALVLQTDALDVLSAETGDDVRAMIVDKMIWPSIEWLRTFMLRYHNNDYPSYVGIATLGKTLGDSSLIHEVVDYTEEYLRLGFLFDGFWKETTLSYHLQSVNGLFRIAAAAKGWSDAEGYSSPRTGRRFTDLDLVADMAVLNASSRIPNVLVYPDGKLFPMADTWAASTASQPEFGVGSVAFGGGGVARLSRGGVPATGPFGTLHQFPELEVTDHSVDVVEFAASGTMQLEASGAGATVTFAFEVEDGDTYDLDLLPFHAGTYGQYEIAVDDEVIAEHDFFNSGSGSGEFVTLGQLALDAGEHHIRFTCTGQHADSGGFKMGVITLALLDEAARADRDEAEPPEQANPSQAYLLLTPKYGHNQWDPLSLAVWSEGQELLPDLGYTHTKYRRWTCSALGHNTVVVDSDDMDSGGRDGGSVEVFDHSNEAVQVVRAEFGTAYPQTSRYQRETWSIEHPNTDRHAGYLLDLFRVSGGERHEYTLNGDANHDAEMTTTAETSPYGDYLLPEGVTVTEPETEIDYGDAEGHYYGYIYVRDVERADLGDGAYELSLSTTVDDQPGSGAHVLGLAGTETELFLGQSPSVRATRLNGSGSDTNDEAEKYWMPKLVLRREGTDLKSSFVTMIEPHGADEELRIEAIELVEHDGGDDDLAVRVTHLDGTVDLILSSVSGEGTLTAGGASLTGRLGFVRLVDDEATLLHLVGGTELTGGGSTLSSDGPVTGTITGTRRVIDQDEVDALVTTGEVPDWIAGHTLVVTHPDGKTHPYPVKQVSTDGNSTVIELDGVDPGFTVDGDRSEMVYTPFTRWSGETTFRVDNSESN